jgi:hypothetical protein
MYSNSFVINRLVQEIVNLLKPSKIEFVQESAPLLAMSDAQVTSPQWLEYIYRAAHPALLWHLALDGLLLSSTIFFMPM